MTTPSYVSPISVYQTLTVSTTSIVRASVTDALGHAKTTSYDAMSNPTSVRNARGQTTQYTYDRLNRPTTKQMPVTSPRQSRPI